MAAPPHFRPLHLEAAIKAGKHVLPKSRWPSMPRVSSRAGGLRRSQEEESSVVSGFCWRYDFGAGGSAAGSRWRRRRDRHLEAVYNASLPGKKWPMLREKGWSDMEWEMRNWYWFTWLSGDHIVEQAVHSIDKIAWVLHDQPPLAAVSLGGMQCRKASSWPASTITMR